MFGGHAHGRIGKSAHGKLGGRVLSRFRGSVRVVSAGVFSTGWMGTNTGKLPVEPVGSARRSKRLEGVRRQYVVEALFRSITDDEGGDDVIGLEQ